MTDADRSQKERTVFAKYQSESLPASLCGVEQLVLQLQALQSQQLATALPKLCDGVRNQIAQTEAELMKSKAGKSGALFGLSVFEICRNLRFFFQISINITSFRLSVFF